MVYYKGNEPTFAYTETVEAALSYAVSITTSQKNDKEDTLSIIEVSTDKIVFYSQGENIVNKLKAKTRPTIKNKLAAYSWVRLLMNWMGLGMRLAKPSN